MAKDKRGKTKAKVQQAVQALPQKKQAEARKMLDKAIGKSGKGNISAKELEKFQKKFPKSALFKKIIHPRNKPIGEDEGKAPGPLPSSYYFDDDVYDPGPPPPVRVPDRDVVNLATESLDAETITNLLFENIGANELTKFVRHDTVEGINPYYDIISNLSDIKRRFDPASLISLQKSNLSNFDIFPIKLQDKIPDEKYLEDNNLSEYVFFGDNGDLIIEVVNMADSEIVEVQIDTSGTIYEIEELYDNE
jgi:hypothetical protein